MNSLNSYHIHYTTPLGGDYVHTVWEAEDPRQAIEILDIVCHIQSPRAISVRQIFPLEPARSSVNIPRSEWE